MIHYGRGDIFATKVDALAHGCNCEGKMGAGIALQFKRKYPEMYKVYAQLCSDGHLEIGDQFMWDKHEPVIFNLMTQPDTRRSASVLAIKNAVQEMLLVAYPKGIRSIAMPIIGCGLGGLDWDEQVKPALESIDTNGFDIYVAVDYIQGKSLVQNP